MVRIKVDAERMGWKPVEDKDTKRIKEGVAMMRRALEEDEIKRRARGSGLPADWRNRIIRARC